MIKIENTEILPISVKPGESIEIKTTYYLYGPEQRKKINVKETRIIQYNGKAVMNPLVREVIREQGLFSSIAKLPIPEDAAPGEYEVITTIDSGQKSDTRTNKFVVNFITSFHLV